MTANRHSAPNQPISDAVQGLVDDIDAYLCRWLDRLQQGLQVEQASDVSDETLRMQLQQLQLRQQQWEIQRRHQQQQIDDQAELLTAAWLRLEDEQRRLLQGGGPQQHAGSPVTHRSATSQPASSVVSIGNSTRAPSPTPVPSPTPAPSPTTVQNNTATSSGTRHAAIAQFQQLRREIETHRPLAHD